MFKICGSPSVSPGVLGATLLSVASVMAAQKKSLPLDWEAQLVCPKANFYPVAL